MMMRYACVTADVHLDIGYSDVANRREPSRSIQPRQTRTHQRHTWKLTHRHSLQARHVCAHCACVRITTVGDHITTRYTTQNNTCSDRAPQCRQREVTP
jgi:hypothetical protein